MPKGQGFYKSVFAQKLEGVFDWTVEHKEPDGTFTGLVVGGEKNGYGVKRFTNGNVYEGEWFSGKQHFFGILTRRALERSILEVLIAA